jgi:hypothetical protein
MGLRQTLKETFSEAKSIYQTLESMDANWGRILSIEKKWSRWVVLRVEIHHADLAPFERLIETRLPRGLDPVVGREVYTHKESGQHSGVEVPYHIKWDRPPQYGAHGR